MAEYFHTGIDHVGDEKDSELILHTSSYIHSSPRTGRDTFNEVSFTAEELKNLYKTGGGKQHTELLN